MAENLLSFLAESGKIIHINQNFISKKFIALISQASVVFENEEKLRHLILMWI